LLIVNPPRPAGSRAPRRADVEGAEVPAGDVIGVERAGAIDQRADPHGGAVEYGQHVMAAVDLLALGFFSRKVASIC
jgi:hypothetical protein